MRALPIAFCMLLAGCLGAGEDVDPSDLAGNVTGNGSDEEPAGGICVIGVESPCNGPEWRQPTEGGTTPPCVPASFKIEVEAPAILETGTNVTLHAIGSPAAATPCIATTHAPVRWDFGDGSTLTAPGPVTKAWTDPGSYRVTATLSNVVATALVGVRLNETWEGVIAAGDGGPCLAPGTTCAEMTLDLPANATRVRFAVTSPEGLEYGEFTVQVVSPANEMVADAKEVEVTNPQAGAWALTVHGLGVNARYVLTATADFASDV